MCVCVCVFYLRCLCVQLVELSPDSINSFGAVVLTLSELPTYASKHLYLSIHTFTVCI